MGKYRNKKGLAIETIGIITIGFVSLFVLLSFLGVINLSVNRIFCSVYSTIAEPPAFCEMATCSSERYKIMDSDTESFTREIAAHAITCYQHKAGCLQENNVRLCYALLAEERPDDNIYEYNVTKLLEDEGGCDVLENNVIVDENGDAVIYDGNCGIHDTIEWQVRDTFIRNQPLILIEYNEINDTVMVKA